jgi:hypothetical protein
MTAEMHHHSIIMTDSQHGEEQGSHTADGSGQAGLAELLPLPTQAPNAVASDTTARFPCPDDAYFLRAADGKQGSSPAAAQQPASGAEAGHDAMPDADTHSSNEPVRTVGLGSGQGGMPERSHAGEREVSRNVQIHVMSGARRKRQTRQVLPGLAVRHLVLVALLPVACVTLPSAAVMCVLAVVVLLLACQPSKDMYWNMALDPGRGPPPLSPHHPQVLCSVCEVPMHARLVLFLCPREYDLCEALSWAFKKSKRRRVHGRGGQSGSSSLLRRRAPAPPVLQECTHGKTLPALLRG